MAPYDDYVKLNSFMSWIGQWFESKPETVPSPQPSIPCAPYSFNVSLKGLKEIVEPIRSHLPFLALFGDPISRIPNTVQVEGNSCSNKSVSIASLDSSNQLPLAAGMAIEALMTRLGV